MTTRQKIETLTRTRGREIVDAFELATAGVTKTAVTRAVNEGWLRKGYFGFYLAKQPDPGAIAVMRAVMNERDDLETE